MSFVHKQECVGFMIDDDECPTVGNVSCAHLEASTLKCKFFLGGIKCDDLVLAPTVPLVLHTNKR
jgi:hypothetical protein